MLILHIEAPSGQELIAKVIAELGLVMAPNAAPAVTPETGSTGMGTAPATAPPSQSAPAAASRQRKPRNDAGKERGPNARTKNAAPAVTPASPATLDVKGEPSTQSAPVAASNAPKLEDARAALSKVFQTKGVEAALDLLKPYKVTRVQDIPAEKFAEFIAAAEKA